MPDAVSRTGAKPRLLARRGLRIAASCAALALLALLLRALQPHELLAAVAHARLHWIGVAALLTLAGVSARAVALRALVLPTRRIPIARTARYTLAGITGCILAPLRAGDALRAWLLVRHEGLPMATCAALYVCERIGDIVALAILAAPLPWLLAKTTGHVRIVLATIVVVAVFALSALFLLRRAPFFRAIRRRVGAVGSVRSVLAGLLAILAAWALDLFEVMVVLRAVGVDAGYAEGSWVLLAMNVATVVPAAPANSGTLELGALFALDLVGVPRSSALAFALLYHAAQVVPVLIAGSFGGVLAWRSRFRAEHARPDVSSA